MGAARSPGLGGAAVVALAEVSSMAQGGEDTWRRWGMRPPRGAPGHVLGGAFKWGRRLRGRPRRGRRGLGQSAAPLAPPRPRPAGPRALGGGGRTCCCRGAPWAPPAPQPGARARTPARPAGSPAAGTARSVLPGPREPRVAVGSREGACAPWVGPPPGEGGRWEEGEGCRTENRQTPQVRGEVGAVPGVRAAPGRTALTPPRRALDLGRLSHARPGHGPR